MRFFFRKSQRVVRDRDFKAVLAHKCFVSSGLMRLYAAPNRLDISRFAVSVSRKFGPAVQRNRIKRLAREVYRLHQDDLPTGRDYILILVAGKPIKRESAAAGDYKAFELQFLRLVDTLCRKPCFGNP